MRCDRFRADMMEKPLRERTRAERALFFRHGKNCVECWNWLIEMCQKYGKSVASKLCCTPSMITEDNQDPEFAKVFNMKEIIE